MRGNPQDGHPPLGIDFCLLLLRPSISTMDSGDYTVRNRTAPGVSLMKYNQRRRHRGSLPGSTLINSRYNKHFPLALTVTYRLICKYAQRASVIYYLSEVGENFPLSSPPLFALIGAWDVSHLTRPRLYSRPRSSAFNTLASSAVRTRTGPAPPRIFA